MSTTDFKNMYVVVIILTLLFGVGLGYQIHTWVNPESNTTESISGSDNNTNTAQEGSTPRAVPEVYARTGKVESVSPDAITFTTLLQNTDSTYSETTLTATLTDDTVYTKINLGDASGASESIERSDISVGNEVAVTSSENIYGKTKFTATTVQLHQF